MSIWADINRRSQGIQTRKENKEKLDLNENAWLVEQIGLKLKSFKVDVGKCLPIKMMHIVVLTKTRYAKIKTVTCASVVHSDGSRDFCSSENISKIIKCVGDDEFVSIN